jgi:hypothetical protein
LKETGQITLEEFRTQFSPRTGYLTRPDGDSTTATFFDRFNLDPKDKNAKVRAVGREEIQLRDLAKKMGQVLPEHEPVLVAANGGFDFRLNEAELAALKRNGFVVSERMGASSCGEMFYHIYKRDLPVLITTDAVLHAWHRTYDALLEEVETAMLLPALEEILAALAAEVPRAHARYGHGALKDSVLDADYFLAVARSLLAGRAVPSALGQEGRVAQTLEGCRREALEGFDLFGRRRLVDFSQFKPRGHYEKSEALQRYFQAMMWCGRIDLRVAGNPKESSPRELASAVVLHDLLQRSGKFQRWSQFDQMLQMFAGRVDSMTFAQLGVALKSAGVCSPADLRGEAELTKLRSQLESGTFGAQEIRGDAFAPDPDRPGVLLLPRSFTVVGQRFAVDSWALSKLVYDDIRWDDEFVKRRIPSCLDVSFAVLGNDHAVPLLAERINNAAGRVFRDGLPYQHNLAAVRKVIDTRPEAMWQENLYTGWLGCLRELSKPTTGPEYPQVMRTEAWAMKTLNTQHASWTQLRHDTVLYAKQSYTPGFMCYYPAGYVEPVPHFWARLEQMATRAGDLIRATPYDNVDLQAAQVKFLRGFASTVRTLHDIAVKELAQQELSEQETRFLENVIEFGRIEAGSGSVARYKGWYPGLFYFGAKEALKWDAVVADVHTDIPDGEAGDPGCVLHQGVGSVDLLLVVVDSGKERMMFAGPVLSHYEFEMPKVTRKSDAEWKKDLQAGRTPPRPEWTRNYLVPGENPRVQRYDPSPKDREP